MGLTTIGKRIDPDLAAGDAVVLCDYCGVPNYRSRMRRDGAGLLACPQEHDGKDAVTLSKEIAAAARAARERVPPIITGNVDRTTNDTASSHITDSTGFYSGATAAGQSPLVTLGSNLYGWWRSDSVTESDGVISAVPALGGTSYALTAAGDPEYDRSGSLGNTPTIELDGEDDVLSNTSIDLGTSDFSGWIVCRPNLWLPNRRVISFWKSDGFANVILGTLSSGGTRRWRLQIHNGTQSATADVYDGATQGSYHLIRFEVNSSASRIRLDVDGVVTTSDWSYANANLSIVKVGSGFVGANYTNLSLKEVVLRSGVPTISDISSVNEYLEGRYGL